MTSVKREIVQLLKKVGIDGPADLTTPPKPEMGDFAFACFDLAKKWKMSPVDAAKQLSEKIVPPQRDPARSGERLKDLKIIERVMAMGPYVNFYLNSEEVAKLVMDEAADKDFGKSKSGQDKKVLVEFAHPNTHKAFHIGHLRNIVTGESLSRIFENAGYKVIRANYQGDVGMHIAKCLWSIWQIPNLKSQISNKFQTPNLKTIDGRVKFLGQAYAKGSEAYEKEEKAKKEIEELNEKIYSRDESIREIYETTRGWSLEYFDKIYRCVGSRFDRLYFESETFRRGKEIVLEFLKKGVFQESRGAVIFEGSKYDLHDRVFINSKGFPVYEAKDLALAELQFKEYNPDVIYHVVAKEQSEYFKVLFKAMEFTLPKSKDKEKHLVYGWVSLKEGKMSSRTGQVVLGEWLLDEVKKKVAEAMKDHEITERGEVEEKVAIAAVKYAFLKTGIENDIVFDFNESVRLTGDSGPYLLYIVARIRSILRKSSSVIPTEGALSDRVEESLKPLREGSLRSLRRSVGMTNVEPAEKMLLLKLSEFGEVTEAAAEKQDPSQIAKYLLALAQAFNEFYEKCPVIKAEKEARDFRLDLIDKVAMVMERGLYLLGVETVEVM